MNITLVVKRYLSDGDNDEEMNALALLIAKTDVPETLASWSLEIYTVVAEMADAPYDRIATVCAAGYLAEYHAALFSEQQGKHGIQHWRSCKPLEYDRTYFYDFEKGLFEHIFTSQWASRTEEDANERRMARLDEQARVHGYENQYDVRVKYNQNAVERTREQLQKSLDACGFLAAAERAFTLAKLTRTIPLEHQLPRALILDAAHLYVLGLFTRVQTFVRQCKSMNNDPWVIQEIEKVFRKYECLMKCDVGMVRGVRDAYAHTIMSACIDMILDVQGFIQRKMHEARQTALLMSIEKRLIAIHNEVQEANTQLSLLNQRARFSERLEIEQRDLTRAGLLGIGALGAVLSSFHIDVHSSASYGGIFGGGSHATHMSAGPRIAFRDAYAHLEAVSISRDMRQLA